MDFATADAVFSGATIEFEDTRRDYGEIRMITVGADKGRWSSCVTPRGTDRHILSMRKANEREQQNLGSNLIKVDRHEITEAEYAEIPEVTDEEFARATVLYAGRPARGRPPTGSSTKQLVSLRLDPEIQARFRSSGSGWQARMNTFLLHNEVVLKMIVEFDDAIGDMEEPIGQLRAGGLRPINDPVETSIGKVERNIGMTKDTVRALRNALVWEPTEPVG